MTGQAPNIDRRTAATIAAQVQNLLTVYVPEWNEFDPVTGKPRGVSAALIGAFARLCELIIQRLNQAPQKNFLAFLDLLGSSRLPPQPARVPITFFLAPGSAVDGLVLAGTQVAAPPAKGEKDPVIFETERELVVTAAQLTSLFVRDPEQDQQAERSQILTSGGAAPGALLFRGDQPIEHILYIGHSRLFAFSHISNARLTLVLQGGPLQDTREVRWELWDGFLWTNQTPAGDPSVRNLTTSGDLNFGAIAPIPETTVNTLTNRWFRGRLITPITIDSVPRLAMVRATDLPRVRSAHLSVDLLRPLSEGLTADAALTNAVAIAVEEDFAPFGEKPKANDAFYLASAEAFSKDRAGGLSARGAEININFDVTNSHLLPTEKSVYPSPDLQLTWECWNGQGWQQVGLSKTPEWLSLLELDPFPETTTQSSLVITGRVQRGAAIRSDTLVGQPTGTPARVLNVGADGRFALIVPSTNAGLNLIQFTASLAGRETISWVAFFREGEGLVLTRLNFTAPSVVTAVFATVTIRPDGGNAGQVTRIRITNGSLVPVETTPNTPVAVLLNQGRNHLLVEAFSAFGARLAARVIIVSREANAPAPDPVTRFVDRTHAFSQSGVVTLTLPDTVARTSIGGQENFWLRVRISKGDYGRDASYRLKNPAAPEEGFTLVLDTFRPPVISNIRIGYQQTLTGPPEVMFAYNNSTFEFVNNAGPFDAAFTPFRRAPEDRPTVYAGFTLPSGTAVFPNSPITLYAHVEGLKYGEKAAPISPDQSKKVSDQPIASPPTLVRHKFFLTNPTNLPASYSFTIFGTRLPAPPAPPVITVQPQQSSPVEVVVTIPPGTPPGSRDEGILQVINANEPGFEYTASFITFVVTEPPTDEQLGLVWEYWNGRDWSVLTVRDDTENFTRPGLIEFLAPPNFRPSVEFGLPPRYWLRVRWESGEYDAIPRLTRMLPNTTIAAQTVTIRNETLGSSDGSENQKFQSTQSPILIGQRLEVREPEMPSAAELEQIALIDDREPVKIIRDAAGRARQFWVHWHEVRDFYGSGPRDRHYVIDHLTGEIRTGDGLNGLIPPAGIGNVRLAHYQTGGGSAGNKPAGSIVQLKTTVPYVDKVINLESASGGADAETLDSLLTRAPRSIRHSGRAVTVEDYEDLAMLASPEVARAKCVALRNLADDPLDEQPTVRGEVSVVIVPRSRDAKPLPSLELLSRVQDYLEARSVPTSHVSVVGPLYIRVDVNVEIALASLEGASLVQHAVNERIASFLHPLTGGLDGTGWDFGREAHESDLYALIESVPGVDHIRSLKKIETEDMVGVRATRRFLVFSGTHSISMVFERD